MRRFWRSTIWFTTLALVLGACGTGDATPSPSEGPGTSAAPSGSQAETADCGNEALAGPVPIRFILQWTPQAQFAGYFAARELGYYEDVGLEVDILDGGPTIPPQQEMAPADGPELGEGWVPKVLVANEEGADLVNIAQVFQRSGTLEVSWADSGIDSPEDWGGKNIGAWGFGNEYEVLAAARKAGLADTDWTRVTQDFNMALLLNREIDAAEAMIYNELAQLLEVENPDTGELYTLDDLNVVDFNEYGTAMLQDHVIARRSWLAEETNGVSNEQIAMCFLRASFQGWMYCRDNPDECVDITLDQGTILGEGHQRWQMNEINALIWPSPDGIGMLDLDQWQQTVDISKEFGILTEDPAEWAYRTDLAEAALAGLDGDVTGADFEKGVVEVTPGGE